MTDWTSRRPGAREDRWPALYRQALARGAHPDLDADQERLLRPLEHLAMATARMPGVAMLLPTLLVYGPEPVLSATLRSWAARLVRSTARGLEAHARDAGYRPDRWIADGVAYAELRAHDAGDDASLVVTHLEDAAQSIAGAIVATEADVMAVPEQLSWALGAALALYATVADG